jgi:uncharacterized membrane protein YphA (DoxX/SURF4 family)
LCLLRVVLGMTILAESRLYFVEPKTSPGAWAIGSFALGAGVLLLIGFLTPIAAAVTLAAAVGVGLSFFPLCSPNLFDSSLALLFGLTMLVAILGLGPGAFSVDARMFGRREIIIPPPVAE